MSVQDLSYAIESRGVQSNGVRVVEPFTMETLLFASRKAARAYADSIVPEMPSKNLPLVVVQVSR